MRRILFSLINLSFAIFFIFIGFFSLFLPWSTTVQMGLIEFILDDALVISLFGFTFLMIAFGLIVNTLINAKVKYYYINSDKGNISVNESVVHQIVTTCLQNMFPNDQIASQLKIKDNHLEIITELPLGPSDVQQVILEQLKSDLQQQFSQTLGPHVTFTIKASQLVHSPSL